MGHNHSVLVVMSIYSKVYSLKKSFEYYLLLFIVGHYKKLINIEYSWSIWFKIDFSKC